MLRPRSHRPGWMERVSPSWLTRACSESLFFPAAGKVTAFEQPVDSANPTQVLTWYRARTADTAPLWLLLWPLELYLTRGELGKKKRGKHYRLSTFGLQLQITSPFKWQLSTNTKHTYFSAQWIDARVGGDRERWKHLSWCFWILSLNYSQLGKVAVFSSQHQPTAVLGY